MSNAVGAITYASVAGFPVGSAVDHVEVSVVDQANNITKQNVPNGTASVTFPNLPDGSYTFTIQAFSAAGAGYGTPVTGTFTLQTAQTISLSLPSAAQFSQQ